MYRAPLYEKLKGFAQSDPARFFMPGHKGKKIDGCYLSPLFPYDVTELPDTGCLYEEGGAIGEGQKLLARAYGAKQAFFLTGGSTQGNFCSLYLATRRNRRVLMDRNLHKSALHAAVLLDLEVRFLVGDLIEPFNIPAPPDAESIGQAIRGFRPGAVFLTSPTYMGICADVEQIYRVCLENGVALVIDGAHGAHFSFSPLMPPPPQQYSDYCTLSAHKTLPALTQGAYLTVNAPVSAGEVREAMAFTGSSSPSFLLMASLDYARAYMEEYGGKKLAEIVEYNRNITDSIKSRGFITLDETFCLPKGLRFDAAKLLIHAGPLSGQRLYDALYRQNVLCEMTDGRNVLAMPALLCEKEDYERLKEALLTLRPAGEGEPVEGGIRPGIPERAMPMREAFFGESEWVRPADSKGRVSAGIVSTFPPGTVLLAPGEKIDENFCRYLCLHINGNIKVLKGGFSHEAGFSGRTQR